MWRFWVRTCWLALALEARDPWTWINWWTRKKNHGWWSWWLVMNVSNFLWWWLFQIHIIDYKPIRYHHFFVKLLAFQTSFGLCGRLPKEAKRHEIGLLQPITMLFCSQSLRCIGAVTAIRSHKGGPKKYCKNGGSWAVVNLRNFFSGPLLQLLTS